MFAASHIAFLLLAAIATRSRGDSTRPLPLPLYFLDLHDVSDTFGRIRAKGTTAIKMEHLNPPTLNYTAGANIFAAFQNNDEYEVWAAVGRPGEPLTAAVGTSTNTNKIGVSVLRFTTKDLVHYTEPVELLFLESGSGSPPDSNDFSTWTVKSMDRNEDDPVTAKYVLIASYQTGVHTFINTQKSVTTSSNDQIFQPTTGSLHIPNFVDHDDANIIYDVPRKRWIDMQIQYENLTQPKRFCDNVLGARRTVSARIGLDSIGQNWSSDLGCLDRPQIGERCQSGFNTTNMVRPNDAARIAQGRRPDEDPPELEFYRIRPFRIPGNLFRLAAHVLLYVPSPSDVVHLPNYGRQPLWYCTSGCCHGPHMYEEWWIGPASGDPADLSGWRRPYDLETRSFPHDVWAMQQPVLFKQNIVWIDSGHVWSIPAHRLGGLHSVSNGQFSTKTFEWPLMKKNDESAMWLETDAKWGEKSTVGSEWCDGGCNGIVTDGKWGSDEGHQAYVQVEILDVNGTVFPGYGKKDASFTNVNGRIQLTWNSKKEAIRTGTIVKARVYFRDAIVYALGVR